MVDVLSSRETWLIAVLSFVLNWMAVFVVWAMYRVCCVRGRKGNGIKVANSDLTQRMLEAQDDDLEMQQPL